MYSFKHIQLTNCFQVTRFVHVLQMTFLFPSPEKGLQHYGQMQHSMRVSYAVAKYLTSFNMHGF